MKLFTVVSVLALGCFSALAVPASGDDRLAQLHTADRDGDGFISRSEAEAFRGGRFEEMDLDGDGAISRGEMMDRIQRRMEREFGQRFDAFDRNRDGRIDRSEYGGRNGGFERLDVNRDGRISREELRRRRR